MTDTTNTTFENTATIEKPKGITKLKDLQKRVMELPQSFLQEVRLRDDYDYGYYARNPNNPLPKRLFNTSTKYPNPHLGFGDVIYISNWWDHTVHLFGKTKKEMTEEERKGFENMFHTIGNFYGGKHGRCRNYHSGFTQTNALVDKEGVIVSVYYYPDNDLLNEFLRDVLDPSIPNNYEDAHARKEYDLVITTHHITQQTVKVYGRTFDEARRKLVAAEPDLDVMKKMEPMWCAPSNLKKYNGMRTTENQGVSPCASSYEEWQNLVRNWENGEK